MGRFKQMHQDIQEEYNSLTAEQAAWIAGFCASQAVDHSMNHPDQSLEFGVASCVVDFLELKAEGNQLVLAGWALMNEYFRAKLENDARKGMGRHD